MTAPTTVIIATMPGREKFLAEARASVDAQTEQPADVLVRCEAPGALGPNPLHLAHQRNQLLAEVKTPWVTILDDDDLWLPQHIKTIAGHMAMGDADVIYTWPTERVVYMVDVNGWPTPMLAQQLRRTNLIPSAATIRVAALEKVGGWSEDYDLINRRFASGCTWEDWDLWLRLAELGATFRCVPQPTWTYRVHDTNSSRLWAQE